MTPETIAALFSGPLSDPRRSFRFARWGRPLAPVVFGLDDASVAAFRDGLDTALAPTGLTRIEIDPEMGANLMVFALRDWAELTDIPDLDRLAPGLAALSPGLSAAGANQYRLFRHDPDGSIRAALVFLRLDAALTAAPLAALALDQAVRALLLWGEGALAAAPPVIATADGYALRPEIAALLRAAYDPRLPAAATDPSLALRLAARISA